MNRITPLCAEVVVLPDDPLSRVVTCRLLMRALDADAFRQAREAVVRQSVLRTTFVWEGADEPIHIAWRAGATTAVEIEDWLGAGAGEQQTSSRFSRIDHSSVKAGAGSQRVNQHLPRRRHLCE
ncbi:hypothetical protein WMF11_45430 [Sorangium sp. So ce295]|jgi:hypothetical protein|uniref:hypothetical protein n=1 Tax=Sorangium sp. So ce295 TaxID=3133295 RepID=UPI003F5FAA4D